MTVGNKISQLRNEKKVTRSDLSKAIGVSRSAIAMYERGERIPKDSIKVKIAAFFGKSVESIFFVNQLHNQDSCQ